MLSISLKTFTLGSGLAVAASLGATPRAFADTEITFYHYQSGGNYDAFRAILDDFEAQNDDITVKDIFAQSQQITAEVQAALAAGRPVDVATVIGKNIVYFLNNTDAVDLVEASNGDTEWLDELSGSGPCRRCSLRHPPRLWHTDAVL